VKENKLCPYHHNIGIYNKLYNTIEPIAEFVLRIQKSTRHPFRPTKKKISNLGFATLCNAFGGYLSPMTSD
jgi:hypothetical protein